MATQQLRSAQREGFRDTVKCDQGHDLEIVVKLPFEFSKNNQPQKEHHDRAGSQFQQQRARRSLRLEQNVSQGQHQRRDWIELINLTILLRDDGEGIKNRYQPEQDGIARIHHVPDIANVDVERGKD